MKLEYRSYKHLSWGPIAAILVTLGIFFSIQFGIFTFYTFLLAVGRDTDQVSAWFSDNTSAQFIFSAVIGSITLGLLYVFLRSRKAKLAELGLVKPRWKDIGYVAAGLGVYLALYIFIIGVLGKLVPSLNIEQQQDIGFSTSSSGSALILVFVALVVLPPLVEEIVSRGFLYSGLRKGMLFLPAAIISSSLFALAHLLGGEGGSLIWIAVIDTFVLAMVLAYLRERSGSLWPSIGLHATKNFIAFLFLFVFKIM